MHMWSVPATVAEVSDILCILLQKVGPGAPVTIAEVYDTLCVLLQKDGPMQHILLQR